MSKSPKVQNIRTILSPTVHLDGINHTNFTGYQTATLSFALFDTRLFHAFPYSFGSISEYLEVMSYGPLKSRKKARKELSGEERTKIIGAYQCGVKAAAIARTLGFPPHIVYQTIDRYRKTGSEQPKPRPGRPEKLSNRDQRVVKRVVLEGRRRPLHEITNEVNARLGTTLCKDTVRKYVAKAGFRSCVACKKPLLSEKTLKPGLRGV